MKNHKQLLMDFYLELLKAPYSSRIREYQYLYASVRDTLAVELEEDSEIIQRIFERMAAEDESYKPKGKVVCDNCHKQFKSTFDYAEHQCAKN